jgi:hypothetical protein
MKVNLKCFADLSEGDVCDFTGSDHYEISEGETVESLVDRLGMPDQNHFPEQQNSRFRCGAT